MFVTDTHPLVWFTTNKHALLSPKALTVFEQADAAETLIYVPAVVFWEIALLNHLGKVKLKERFDRWASDLLNKQGFAILPLEPAVIASAIGYNFNNDSFDKIIVASALDVDAPLITKDVAITESNLIEVYW